MVLAINESHPLASRTEVTYEELVHEQFLSFEENSVLYQNFVSKTKEAGYAPQIKFKAPETPLLLSIIENGEGALVLPECVVNYRKYDKIRTIPIVGEEEGYQLVLIYAKDKYLSTASQAFIDFIKEWYQEGGYINV